MYGLGVMTYPLKMTLFFRFVVSNNHLFSALFSVMNHVLGVLAGSRRAQSCTPHTKPLPHSRRSLTWSVGPAARAGNRSAAKVLQTVDRAKGFGSLPEIPGAKGAISQGNLMLMHCRTKKSGDFVSRKLIAPIQFFSNHLNRRSNRNQGFDTITHLEINVRPNQWVLD